MKLTVGLLSSFSLYLDFYISYFIKYKHFAFRLHALLLLVLLVSV